MTYQEEEKKLFLDYLNNHVFTYWKESQSPESDSCRNYYHQDLELIVTPTCNTKCTYCYYNNFADKYLYPNEINNKDTIIENCEKVMKWIYQNNYRINIEIFSGEFINLPYAETILEIINRYSQKDIQVSIPTNGTFCRSEKTLEKAQSILDKYNLDPESNINIYYSLSVDGKYLDNSTRPMKDGTLYDDAFYDRLFKFAVKNNMNFHPMIAANGIEHWKENYNWYIENIVNYAGISEKEAIDWIYLLEVRNPDWTPDKCLALEDFTEFLVEKTFNAYGRDIDSYVEFLKKFGNFNFFSTLIGSIGRGLGCGLQQNFSVRLGDLALVPCHRTAYDGYNAGYLKFDENSNLDIELENPNIYMFINSFNAKNGVKCCDCPIRELCSLYCLGTNYEVNKDFFIPVENVCLMEYAKIKAAIKKFDEIGILDILFSFKTAINMRKKYAQVTNIRNLIKKEE